MNRIAPHLSRSFFVLALSALSLVFSCVARIDTLKENPEKMEDFAMVYRPEHFDNSYISFFLPEVQPENVSLAHPYFEIQVKYASLEHYIDISGDAVFLNPSQEFFKKNYPPPIEIPTGWNKDFHENIFQRFFFRGGCEYFFPVDSNWANYYINVWPPFDKARIHLELRKIYVPKNYTLRFFLNKDMDELNYEFVPTKTNFEQCNFDK